MNYEKGYFSLQKDVQRLKYTCTKIFECNKLRKGLITQFDMFIKKLLDENRITKEEISQFMDKKPKSK